MGLDATFYHDHGLPAIVNLCWVFARCCVGMGLDATSDQLCPISMLVLAAAASADVAYPVGGVVMVIKALWSHRVKI
jgi:hypothetical protein